MFIHDGEVAVPAYDTPRFAPLRNLLKQLALERTIISWSEKYHVAVPSGGPGKPAFTIWIKKNASDANPGVYLANFCFRFDNSNSSCGFSIEALRAKLGCTTCADAGLEWLTVVDDSFHAGPTTLDDDGNDRQSIIAVRDDDLFDVDIWLYVEDVGTVWGSFPKRATVQARVVEASEESGEVSTTPTLAALPRPNPRPSPNPNQDGAVAEAAEAEEAEAAEEAEEAGEARRHPSGSRTRVCRVR